MKKVALLTIIILLVTFASNAWSIGLLTKGVKVGIGISSLSISPEADNTTYSSNMAIMFGGFVRTDIIPMLAIQPELLIVIGKGQKSETEVSGQTSEVTTKINYLEIPVLFKYKIPVVGVKPTIYLGPALGIKIGASTDPEFKDADGKIVDPKIKSTDLGFAFGADLQMPMGLLFDLRYTLGLTNIDDSEEPDPEPPNYEDPSFKNGNISIMVGYAF